MGKQANVYHRNDVYTSVVQHIPLPRRVQPIFHHCSNDKTRIPNQLQCVMPEVVIKRLHCTVPSRGHMKKRFRGQVASKYQGVFLFIKTNQQ